VEKELWQIDQQRGSMKRSQFASLGRRGGRTGPEGRGRQSRGARANRAKRTQFGPGQAGRATAGANRAKRTQFGPGQAGRATAGANRAKRTQFAPGQAGKAVAGANRAKRSQFSTDGSGRDRQCRWQGQSCETKPISPERGPRQADSNALSPRVRSSMGILPMSHRVILTLLHGRSRSWDTRARCPCHGESSSQTPSPATRATAEGGRGPARLAFRPASREIISACLASG